MEKKRIIFATKNEGKRREVSSIFESTQIELLSLNDLGDIPEIEETGNTFEENASIKAHKVFEKFRMPVVADDSGLAAEQLNGNPGVLSARYAGKSATDEENNNKLLNQLKYFPEPHPAKFVCVAVYYDGRKFFKAQGEVIGRIIKEPRGANGFGYDPLFVPEGFNKTMGELPLDRKNEISHRSKAFKALKKFLNS
ncbi:MAG: RdgB/HAM1 family non-canonical purine NTP pyrophosphatase [Ignavibacteria bacterium]